MQSGNLTELTMPDSDRPPEATFVRPPYATLMSRGLRLRCPRCGKGKLFRSLYRMHDRCPECGLNFNRGPGYYLGSIYLNYGITALSMTIMFLIARLTLNVSARTLIWPLFAYCVILPLALFRHCRGLWLAMDCQIDRSVLLDEEHPPVGH